jgi:hypothetical protein
VIMVVFSSKSLAYLWITRISCFQNSINCISCGCTVLHCHQICDGCMLLFLVFLFGFSLLFVGSYEYLSFCQYVFFIFMCFMLEDFNFQLFKQF